VPEKKADKPRYWITHLLKDLDVGSTFKPDALHWTIIPWFVTEMEDEEVVLSFHKWFDGQPPFDITIGQADEFNHKRKILISRITPSKEVLNTHQLALDWFAELEARWAVKNPHVGPDYIPHIRRRQGHNVSEGEVLPINSLSLVRAHRRGDDLRTVAAKVELK
jgi:2'-5' RNA ligase